MDVFGTGIDIHKARIFDIAAGMKIDLTSTAKIIQQTNIENIKKAVQDFRKNFIDSSTPSMYIIDIQKDIIDPVVSIYPKVKKEVLLKEIEEKIKTLGDYISIQKFEASINASVMQAKKELANLDSKNSRPENIHLQYRNVFRDLGDRLSKLFTRTVMVVSDPEYMGQAGKLVLLGKSFTGMRSKVNDTLNPIIRKVTEDTSFSYGNIKAAGHTAVDFGTQYRTNTPLTQETLFLLEAGGQGGRAINLEFEDSFVRKVPIFLDTAVTFTENFNLTANTLLDIGFTVVVPMDAALNSVSGTKYELAAKKALIQDKVLPDLREAIKKRVSWLKDNILKIRNSPNIPEYLAETLKNSLLGKAQVVYKDKDKKSSKIQLDLTNLVLPSLKVLINKTKVPTKKIQIRNRQGQFTSLASIQALLNQALGQQIKTNMRKPGLVNRTGRFAESVKVEKMSQSREGMITAFYDYMKNPYQTFEPGFKQGSEARNPKTVISKSIREIAAGLVGNRLRAVRL